MRLWLLLVVFLVAGCERDPLNNLEAPREFFNKNKVGSSADYGVMKFGTDHVITVHGFTDDFGTCQEIVATMNHNACEETGGKDCLNPYSCALLNR
jgi:hypothetical protein